VPVGRLQGRDLVEAARLAGEFGDGAVRLTNDQNFLLTGVDEGDLPRLLEQDLLQRYTPFPPPFERGVVACTGSEFCRFAIVETKARALEWAREMDRRFGRRIGPEGGKTGHAEVIRMHLSGCPASCAQPQIADIGFRGETAHVGEQIVEAVDIGLGGGLGVDPGFGDWMVGAMPVDSVPLALERLLEGFLAERRSGQSFREWVRSIRPAELRFAMEEAAHDAAAFVEEPA
jgi:ferredoxin-nitrite reductase